MGILFPFCAKAPLFIEKWLNTAAVSLSSSTAAAAAATSLPLHYYCDFVPPATLEYQDYKNPETI